MFNNDKITVNDIINGCQCAIANIAGENIVIRCVTCPIHGDKQFRKQISCPDCGSTEFNHNPLDNSKYICKECGLNFD